MPDTPWPDKLAALGAGSRWRLYGGWAAGLLALAALVGVVARLGEVEAFVRLAQHADPIWLVPAVVAQAVTYVFASAVWHAVLRRAGHERRLRSLIPLGLAKLFTDQAIPSGGFSGSVLVTIAMRRRRIPIDTALAALFVGFVSYNIAYVAASVASLILLEMRGRANGAQVAVVALLIVYAVGVPVLVLALKSWNTRLRGGWLRRFHAAAAAFDVLARTPTQLVKNPRLITEAVCCQLAIFMLDSLTLWLALRAIGMAVEPWIPFAAFIVASAAATVLPIPLGVGTFEAGSVAMLASLGIPLEAALTATLLLRGLTFWLPMLPGVWLARRELKPDRARDARQAR
jgi:uncharacterized protein (TIRG00374 family)